MPATKLRDVRKLADSRAVFELDLPLVELPDLSAAYLPGGALVHARLSFGREQGFPVVQVRLNASLAAACQRCLEPMSVHVDTDSPVLIVESEQEADNAPGGWETFLAPEGRMDFEALAAEELSLALPIVPLHEDAAQCQALAAAAAASDAVGGTGAIGSAPPTPEPVTARPFADLRALLESGAAAGAKSSKQ
ncbi:MAG TPA: YceD family protein [Steroidobacteraceae bacterium]|nr:YceD family protein [Steroidobacteraceae bacterium]